MADTFDVAIIGGGPGGYVAALRAAQLGMRACVIEREHLGGVCLNWGCIPTKALLRSAEVLHLMREARAFGLSAVDVSFDLARIVERSRGVAAKLQHGVRHLLKKANVTVLEGHGRLAGSGRVTIAKDGKRSAEVAARHVILATGARPRALPGLASDGERVWTYKEAMVPTALPASLLVIGAGAIGVEFASFYRTLGSEVTLVEMLDRVLPLEDEEISAAARRAFERQGMKILTSASVTSLVIEGDGAVATVRTKQEDAPLHAERVLVAAGITGNTEDLGLEGTRVKVDRGHIVTDGWSRTDEPGVYAIGDLAGPPWLAHKASHEAVVCVEKIAGLPHVLPLDPLRIPACTYSRPQIASIGLTEHAATATGRTVKVGLFPLSANGKAIALGDTEGMVKTVFDAQSGELLGAHMIGPEVTEMIQGYAVAKSLETTEAELMHTVFPHPTLSEAMHEAVLGAFGRALHV